MPGPRALPISIEPALANPLARRCNLNSCLLVPIRGLALLVFLFALIRVIRGQFRDLADPKTDVPDRFSAEALLQPSQDVDLRHLLELVVQRRLEHAHIKNAFA